MQEEPAKAEYEISREALAMAPNSLESRDGLTINAV